MIFLVKRVGLFVCEIVSFFVRNLDVFVVFVVFGVVGML